MSMIEEIVKEATHFEPEAKSSLDEVSDCRSPIVTTDAETALREANKAKREAVHFALQTAFERQNKGFIQLLFDRAGGAVGQLIEKIDMCRLYHDRGQIDKYGVLTHVIRGNSTLSFNARQLNVKLKLLEGETELRETRIDEQNTHEAWGAYEKYTWAATPLLTGLCKPIRHVFETTDKEIYGKTKMQDLFIWAVITGDNELAHMLWQRCEEEPLRLALMAAHICRSLAQDIAWAKNILHETADEMEGWAISMLESISTPDAFIVLGTHCRQWKQKSVLDLAAELDMKLFLNEPHCIRLASVLWKVPQRTNLFMAQNEEVQKLDYVRLLGFALVGWIIPGTFRRRTSPADDTLADGVYIGKSDTSQQPTWEAQCEALFSRGNILLAKELADKERNKGAAANLLTRTRLPHASLWKITIQNSFALYRKDMIKLYTTPAIKFILRFVLQLGFAAFHFAVIVRHAQDNQSFLEADSNLTFSSSGSDRVYQDGHWIIDRSLHISRWDGAAASLPRTDGLTVTLLIWSIAQAVDKLYEYESDYQWRSCASSLLSAGIMVLYALLQGARLLLTELSHTLTVERLYYIYEVLFSLTTLYIFTNLLRFIAIMNLHVGALIITMRRMLQDLITFSIVFITIVGGFAVTFIVISARSTRTWHDAAFIPIWAVYGDFDMTNVSLDDDAPVLVLLWVFCLSVTVGMLNLMVAMFNDSYTNVTAHAKELFHYYKYKEIAFYRDQVYPIPPPFSLPLLIYSLGEVYAGKLARVDWRHLFVRRRFRVVRFRVNQKFRLGQKAADSQSNMMIKFTTELISQGKKLPLDGLRLAGLSSIFSQLNVSRQNSSADGETGRQQTINQEHNSVERTDGSRTMGQERRRAREEIKAQGGDVADFEDAEREILQKARLFNKEMHKKSMGHKKATVQSIHKASPAASNPAAERTLCTPPHLTHGSHAISERPPTRRRR